MIKSLSILVSIFLFIGQLGSAKEDKMMEISQNPKNWQFFTDQVMGGVSKGKIDFLIEENLKFARLAGYVSTENNGGFIQIRTKITNLKKSISGVGLKVRGNGENYYVFIRTTGTFLPWQYYGSAFPTTEKWKTIKLPLNEFSRSGTLMRRNIAPTAIRSLGIVAYGKDHEAFIDVAEVFFY